MVKWKFLGKTKEQQAYRRGVCIAIVFMVVIMSVVVFAPRVIFPGTFDVTYRISYDGQYSHAQLGLVGVHRVTVTDDRSNWGAAKHFELYVYFYNMDVIQAYNGIGWVDDKVPVLSISLEGLSDDYSWVVENSIVISKPEVQAAVYIQLLGYDRVPSVMANIVCEYSVMCYMS